MALSRISTNPWVPYSDIGTDFNDGGGGVNADHGWNTIFTSHDGLLNHHAPDFHDQRAGEMEERRRPRIGEGGDDDLHQN